MKIKFFLSILTTLTFTNCGSSLLKSNGIKSKKLIVNTIKPEVTINIDQVNTEEKNTFSLNDSVKTIIEQSCSAGTCHHQSDIINFTTFPFDYSGSYTEDYINQNLSEVSDENKKQKIAQKIIIKEMITSIESSYMPPPWESAPIPTESELDSIKEWLEELGQ